MTTTPKLKSTCTFNKAITYSRLHPWPLWNTRTHDVL